MKIIKKKFISARVKPFSNHKKPFDLNECKNKTKLSNEIWRIKSLGHHPKVKWEIDKKCVLYITRKQNAVYYAMSTIKQKKRSRIKMPTPIGVRTS